MSLWFLLLLSGCGQALFVPEQATRAYPRALHTTDTVDMQVFRDGETIDVVNTTAREYRDFDLWINQRYLLHIDQLRAGQTLTLSLWDFFDERGDRFNAGGFWATEESELVRLVEIQPAPHLPMVGLIAIRAEGDG